MSLHRELKSISMQNADGVSAQRATLFTQRIDSDSAPIHKQNADRAVAERAGPLTASLHRELKSVSIHMTVPLYRELER